MFVYFRTVRGAFSGKVDACTMTTQTCEDLCKSGRYITVSPRASAAKPQDKCFQQEVIQHIQNKQPRLHPTLESHKNHFAHNYSSNNSCINAQLQNQINLVPDQISNRSNISFSDLYEHQNHNQDTFNFSQSCSYDQIPSIHQTYGTQSAIWDHSLQLPNQGTSMSIHQPYFFDTCSSIDQSCITGSTIYQQIVQQQLLQQQLLQQQQYQQHYQQQIETPQNFHQNLHCVGTTRVKLEGDTSCEEYKYIHTSYCYIFIYITRNTSCQAFTEYNV